MLITSKDNNRIKEIRKLLNKKYSLEKGLFVIEGENLVEEALKNNLLKELYVLDGYDAASSPSPCSASRSCSARTARGRSPAATPSLPRAAP